MLRFLKVLSRLVIIFFPMLILLSACSIKKMALNMIAETLSSGTGTAFTGDEDPELVRDALPFALKLYESLLEQAPDNQELLMATGRGFIVYANAFVQTPAGMLPDTEYERQEKMLKRAKGFYLRAWQYLLQAMELRYPNFASELEQDRLDEVLSSSTEEDVPYLFWTAAAWMGAFSTDTFDMELLLGVSKAASMMQRALELDEGYSNGTIHEFFISYYASVPEAMGGSEEKARHHFRKALDHSRGQSASPYLALATTVSVGNQDASEYRKLLQAALEIDPDSSPENRLANILNQRKARWLLEHIEDYFLLPENGDSGGYKEGG